MKRFITSLLGTASLLALSTTANAQVIYGTANATVTQNFNWTTTTAATVTWTSNAAAQTSSTWVSGASSLGWYAGSGGAADQDSAQFRVGNGNDGANSGLLINNYFYTSDQTDRSFGGRPTSSIPMNMALRLTNTTGSTLTSFTLGYRLEVTQWRASGTQATAGMSYLIGNPTDWRTDAFTSAATLNLSTVYSGDTATANTNVDGNAAGNFNTLAPTTITGINWTNGSDLWIRWNFGTGTNLPNVGLDDVSFSAVPEPTTWALLAGSLTALMVFRRRRAS